MTAMDAWVRPGITILFAGVQCGLAIFWAMGAPRAEQAFAALSAFTMAAVMFWFKSRDDDKRDAAVASAITASAPPAEPTPIR